MSDLLGLTQIETLEGKAVTATTSKTGLVKPDGTTTSISTDGAITVVNNSHNHTIANVTNLQTTLDGKAEGSKITATLPATAGWYRIATSNVSIGNCMGTFEITCAYAGYHSNTIVNVGISYGAHPVFNQIAHSVFSNNSITQLRIVYNSSYSGEYAYIEIYASAAVASVLTVNMSNFNGWSLIDPVAGEIPTGYTSVSMSFSTGNIVGNATSATTLKTARTIALTGDVTGSISFDGSSNISITTTVVDDSHNHTIANVDDLQSTLDNKLSLSGGTLTGALTSTYDNTYRIVSGNYGTFWRNDGNSLWLMCTNSGDQYGSYNSFRPFQLDLATGKVKLNGCSTTLGRNGDMGNPMTFNWSGQGGQPTWLWGGNEPGTDMYVYNPSNFSVNYANSAGSASNSDKTDGYHIGIESNGIMPYFSNGSGRYWNIQRWLGSLGYQRIAVSENSVMYTPSGGSWMVWGFRQRTDGATTSLCAWWLENMSFIGIYSGGAAIITTGSNDIAFGLCIRIL